MTARPSLIRTVAMPALLAVLILAKPQDWRGSRGQGAPRNEWHYRCEQCGKPRNFADKQTRPPKCAEHGTMKLIKRPGDG
jgi:hypothetical protein